MSNQDTSRIFNSFVPLVESGTTVEVTIGQQLTKAQSGGDVQLLDTSGDEIVYLSVEGPQIELLETDIAGVFPTLGSDTSPDEFLPHIALTRRTLPWERSGPTAGSPWLALLLLRSSEIGRRLTIPPLGVGVAQSSGGLSSTPAISKQAARTAKAKATKRVVKSPGGISATPELSVEVAKPGVLMPLGGGPPLESITVGTIKTSHAAAYARLKAVGLTDSTKVNAVFVPTATFKEVMSFDDLPYLCHVRRAAKDNPLAKIDDDRDVAVVVSGRLPYSGAANQKPELHHAYLVSVEQRSDLLNPTGSTVPLVVLHHWTFTPTKGGDFEEVMKAIRVRPNGGVLRFGNLPRTKQAGEPTLSGNFPAMLDDGGFLLPPAMLHQEESPVEYRGPLRPFAPGPRSKGFAIRPAPEEFAGANPNDPPDYSHAAAFEIGRLAALAGDGIPEALHQIRFGAIVPEVEVPVLVDQMPDALRKPDWVVNPQWWADPYTLPGNQQMLKNEIQLAQLGKADFTGIAAQAAPWKSAVTSKIANMAGIESPATQIDIGTISENTLNEMFAEIVVATQGK